MAKNPLSWLAGLSRSLARKATSIFAKQTKAGESAAAASKITLAEISPASDFRRMTKGELADAGFSPTSKRYVAKSHRGAISSAKTISEKDFRNRRIVAETGAPLRHDSEGESREALGRARYHDDLTARRQQTRRDARLRKFIGQVELASGQHVIATQNGKLRIEGEWKPALVESWEDELLKPFHDFAPRFESYGDLSRAVFDGARAVLGYSKGKPAGGDAPTRGLRRGKQAAAYKKKRRK